MEAAHEGIAKPLQQHNRAVQERLPEPGDKRGGEHGYGKTGEDIAQVMSAHDDAAHGDQSRYSDEHSSRSPIEGVDPERDSESGARVVAREGRIARARQVVDVQVALVRPRPAPARGR
jgi:hypothetical protein